MDTEAVSGDANMPRRIVVGVDGSEHSMAALEWAATQAELSGTVLEIVAAFGPGYQFLSREDADQCMQGDVDDALMRAKTFAPTVKTTSILFEGPPELVLMKEGVGAELLVVGSRGLGGFKGLLLGSVSRKCLHRARCPVVVVTHVPGTSGQEDTSRRIVVGVDGSPSSIAALEWAGKQAELTGSSLEVLLMWEWLTGYGWSPVPSDFEPEHTSETTLNELLEPIRETHPGVPLQAAVIEGHPAPLLTKASQGADLLVVGSRGHGEFVGMLLGSVSEHCAIHAHCPVVVVRDGE
jgi:nucleotide-binding universal stress UspA family protein